MTFNLNNSPRVKANPLLAQPWPQVPQELQELARKQHVASCCSDPYWMRIAQAVPEGEVEFWKNCSLTTIHPCQKACGGFSPERLRKMTIKKILEEMRPDLRSAP